MASVNLPAVLLWLGGVALFIAGLLFSRLFLLGHGSEVENPRRLDALIATLRQCDWNEESTRLAAMDKLFDALVALFSAEVAYYYRSRRARRGVSSLFRWIGYVFGSAGIVAPLLIDVVGNRQEVTGLGYVLLAIAAAAFAGNQLFGGTQGHIRYVTTQYLLERLITGFELERAHWHARLAASAPSEAEIEAGFSIAKRFADEVYKALNAETTEWSNALRQAEDAFRAGLTSAHRTPPGAGSRQAAAGRGRRAPQRGPGGQGDNTE